MNALPRPTFKTDADAVAEREIAAAAEGWSKARYLKIGEDHPQRQKPRIDGLFFRERVVVAFAELKDIAAVSFGETRFYIVAEKKVRCGRGLADIVRVPVFLIARFACGTIGCLNLSEAYVSIPKWGRRDRNSPGDIEAGAGFDWSRFKIVRGVT